MLAVIAPAIAGCGLMSDGAGGDGVVRGGWAWPTSAALPVGATAVPLDVADVPSEVNPDAEYGACPMALLNPMTIHHVPGDAAAPIRYQPVDGGPDLHVRWQVGFSARLAPNLEIVAPDGTVIAREGVPVEGLGGGYLGADDTFGVCLPGYGPVRIQPVT